MVAAVGGALIPAGVASAAPARTNVSIGSEHGGLSGYVSSSNRSCANGRTVKVYKVVGRRSVYAGRSVARPYGSTFRWAIRVPLARYYAQVDRTRSCHGARSGTVSSKR